jgi:hypothetical protein
LHDGHCIREHTVCKNEKCTCKDDYTWNTTAGACVPVPKKVTEMPSTTVPSTEEFTSTGKTTSTEKTTSAKESTSTKEGTSTSMQSTPIVVITKSSTEIMEKSTEEDERTFSKPTEGWKTTDSKKAFKNDDKKMISPGMVMTISS